MGALEWPTVYGIVLYSLLVPLYIFGFMKQYQWRTHYLFRMRYSHEALIQIILCLILVHMSIIRSISFDLQALNKDQIELVDRIRDAFQWTMYNVIYYRTNLIFIIYKQQQYRLHKMGIKVQHIHTFSASSPRTHWSSKFLFSVILVGGLFLFITIPMKFHHHISTFLWLYMWLTGIIIFIVLKVKRVKEGMGCLYECYILYFIWIYYITISIIFDDKFEHFLLAAGYTNKHIIALFTLFFTLYMIKKHKGSLKYPHITNNEQMLALSLNASSIDSAGSDFNSKTVDEIKQSDENKQKEISQNIPVEIFLNTRDNYEIFSKYLALHFCIENLIFIQKVNIFRWCVLKRMNDNKLEEISHKSLMDCYSMKFEFLDKIYKEYNDIIDEKKSETFEGNRDALLEICKNIYNECVADDGENQINIPFSVKNQMDNILMNDGANEMFECYDNFLNLFNDAINDIWVLLHGVYRLFEKSLREKT